MYEKVNKITKSCPSWETVWKTYPSTAVGTPFHWKLGHRFRLWPLMAKECRLPGDENTLDRPPSDTPKELGRVPTCIGESWRKHWAPYYLNYFLGGTCRLLVKSCLYIDVILKCRKRHQDETGAPVLMCLLYSCDYQFHFWKYLSDQLHM